MSILEQIIAHKRSEVEEQMKSRPLGQLKSAVEKLPPQKPLRFEKALAKSTGVSLIAEIKKASPSRGLIRPNFNPSALAAGYERAGAAALSVLTDRKYFQGSDEHLAQVRGACRLPVLRKDFTISAYQVYQARVLGADAVLLIAAVLEKTLLEELLALAGELGLGALVEVHDERDLEQAVSAGAGLIGVNNRDLRSFAVSLEVSERLAPLLPEYAVTVSESGITSAGDVRCLEELGYDAVLVGEHLMRQPDPELAARRLMKGQA